MSRGPVTGSLLLTLRLEVTWPELSERLYFTFISIIPPVGVERVDGVTEALLMTGGSVSFTVTVKEQVDLAPFESVAVHITVVEPNGNTDPGGGEEITVTPGQLPVAAGTV